MNFVRQSLLFFIPLQVHGLHALALCALNHAYCQSC